MNFSEECVTLLLVMVRISKAILIKWFRSFGFNWSVSSIEDWVEIRIELGLSFKNQKSKCHIIALDDWALNCSLIFFKSIVSRKLIWDWFFGVVKRILHHKCWFIETVSLSFKFILTTAAFLPHSQVHAQKGK